MNEGHHGELFREHQGAKRITASALLNNSPTYVHATGY
ncbi:hypothetical protein B0G76_3500 [Paraburkholderia sp. BL23I1N1]|nr:hypothetical protein B0G76_3500 [Paraburkholderia sp. BL23I1N1]